MSKSQFRSQLNCFLDIDDDVESIPDSLDSDFFRQTSRAENTTDDNKTDIVSTVLDGLESTRNESSNDVNVTEESESIFDGEQSLYDNTTRIQTDSKSFQNSQHLSEVGVQTIDNSKPKTVLQSVSIQCSQTLTDRSVQTDDSPGDAVVANQLENNCQSNNCCFHQFIESIPCNSLKTFLNNLIKMNVKKEEFGEKEIKTDTTLAIPPLPLAIEKKPLSVEAIQNNCEEHGEDWPISEEQLASVRLLKVNQSVKSCSTTDSTPKSITEDQRSERQISRSDSIAEQEVIELEMTSEQNKNNKKSKFSEEVIETNVEKEELIVTYEDVVNVCSSSTSATQISEKLVEEPAPKAKPKPRGPRSRQKTVSESLKRESSEEPKPKRKIPKVYVSSSDEEVEENVTNNDQKEEEDQKEDNTYRKPTFSQLFPSKVKTYSKQNKNKTIKTADKPTTEEIVDELKFNKDIQSTSTVKKQTSKRTGSKKMSNLTEESKIVSIYGISDEEKDEPIVTIESKQKIKRKAVPKKKYPIEELNSDSEEDNNNKKKRKTKKQISDTEENLEENEPKTKKYKPKPKSRQKAILSVRETNEETFKRPPSPTPSVTSNSSTSSRQRASSTERSKKVILFSGLDDKQRKKIERVCRELNAEAVCDWTESVTHLVIALAADRPKEDMICPRNAKYIKTLLNNKWIVSYDWILDSSRSGRWIDETKYEIKCDKTATERSLPELSRNSGKKLFAKQMFKFDDKIGGLLSEFKDFVRIGGGIVVDSEDEFIRQRSKNGCKRLIVVNEVIKIPETQRDGIKYINQKSFMASISNFVEI